MELKSNIIFLIIPWHAEKAEFPESTFSVI